MMNGNNKYKQQMKKNKYKNLRSFILFKESLRYYTGKTKICP